MAKTAKPQTAHDTYVAKHAEVMANLKALQIHVETHSMKEAADQKNWGYAGDLDYINKMILQALGKAN